MWVCIVTCIYLNVYICVCIYINIDMWIQREIERSALYHLQSSSPTNITKVWYMETKQITMCPLLVHFNGLGSLGTGMNPVWGLCFACRLLKLTCFNTLYVCAHSVYIQIYIYICVYMNIYIYVYRYMYYVKKIHVYVADMTSICPKYVQINVRDLTYLEMIW